MDISEHHSRVKGLRLQAAQVAGFLLGKKQDHQTEITESFELEAARMPIYDNAISLLLHKDFIEKRLALVKQVSPELDLIGWYSTTPPPQDGVSDHMSTFVAKRYEFLLHRQISEYIPNPIYLKFDPYRREKTDPKISGSMPLKIYEPVIEIVDNQEEQLNLIEVPWTIVTDEIEIIGLEHNAKVTHSDAAPSPAIEYLKLQYNAVKMLKDRIKVISKYVKDVQSGALPYHEEPIRDIINLTQRFPLMNSEQYTRAYNMQCNDVGLNIYLGILTKGSMCKVNFGKTSSKMRALSTTRARH